MAAKVGKYLLFETLGVGTFGKVKLGVHEETGEQVAVKIMDKSHIQKSDLTMQVRREIAIMKALKHKNIVNLHQVLTSSNKLYIVMDLVTGGELFDIIANKGEGGLAENAGREYFQQMVDGVLYCHRRGVYHRDLKPENLLLNADGVLKITDFGLSAIKGADTTTDLLTTQCGTPSYVAPEIIERAAKGYNGEKVDAWASGIILYALTCGYLPFDGADMQELFSNISKCEVDYPSWVSPGALELMKKLLDKNPTTRWTLKQARDHSWFRVGYDDPEEAKRKSKSRRHRKTSSKTDYDLDAINRKTSEQSTPPVTLKDAAKPYSRGKASPKSMATPPTPPITAHEGEITADQETNSSQEAPKNSLPSKTSFAQQSKKWQSIRKSIVFGELKLPPPPSKSDIGDQLEADATESSASDNVSPQATAPKLSIPAPALGSSSLAQLDIPPTDDAREKSHEKKNALPSLASLSSFKYDRRATGSGPPSSANMTPNPGMDSFGSASVDSSRKRSIRTSMLLSTALGPSLKNATATAAVAAVGEAPPPSNNRPSYSHPPAPLNRMETPLGVPPPAPELPLPDYDDDDEGLAVLSDDKFESVQAIRQLQTVIVMSRAQNIGVSPEGNTDFERVLNLWSALERKEDKEKSVLDNEKWETVQAIQLLRDRLNTSDTLSVAEQLEVSGVLEVWEGRLTSDAVGRSPQPVDEQANRTFTNFEKLLNRWDRAIQGEPIAEEIDIPDSIPVDEEEDVFLQSGTRRVERSGDLARLNAQDSGIPVRYKDAFSQESMMLLGNIAAPPALPSQPEPWTSSQFKSKGTFTLDAYDSPDMTLGVGRGDSGAVEPNQPTPFSQESIALLQERPAPPVLPTGVSMFRPGSSESDMSMRSMSVKSSIDYPEVPELPDFVMGSDSSRSGSVASPSLPGRQSAYMEDPLALSRPKSMSSGSSLASVHKEPLFPDRTRGEDRRPRSMAKPGTNSIAHQQQARLVPRDSLYDASELTDAERLEILDDSIDVDDMPDDEDELGEHSLNQAWKSALSPEKSSSTAKEDVSISKIAESEGEDIGQVKFPDRDATGSIGDSDPLSPVLLNRDQERGPGEGRSIIRTGPPTITESTILDPARNLKGPLTNSGTDPALPPPDTALQASAASSDSGSLASVTPISGRSHSSGGGKTKILNKLLGRKGFTSGFALDRCLNEMGKLLTKLHCEVIRKRGEYKLKAVAQASKGTKVQASIEMLAEGNGTTLVLFKKAKAEFGRQADSQTFMDFYNAVVDNFNRLGPEAVLNE